MSDALAAVLWIGVTTLLVTAAWRTSRAIHSNGSPAQHALDTVVLCWSCVVAVATVLGLLGWLVPCVLLAGVATVAAAAHLAVPSIAQRCQPTALEGNLAYDPRERHWWILWGAVAAFWIGHLVTGGLLKFPTDWDSLMYHLPLIVQWLHAKSLYAPDCAHWSFPGNNEIVGLWMAAPFSGDFLIAIINLPAALLLALSAIELGRRVGLSPALRHLAALAVVSHHVLVYQLVNQKNDMGVAALFLATLCYGLRYLETNRQPELVLAAVSLGLLAGVKWFALGYGVVAWTAITVAALPRRGLRAGARLVLVGAAGMMLFGGYWYVRNALITGTPFYPMDLTPEFKPFDEMYPTSLWTTTFIGNPSPEVVSHALSAVLKRMGPCHLVAVVLLPVALVWLTALGVWQRSQNSSEETRTLAVLLALTGAFAVVLVTPAMVEDNPGTLNVVRFGFGTVRYSLSFLSLAVIALACVVGELSGALPCVLNTLQGKLLPQGRAPAGLPWGRRIWMGIPTAVAVLPRLALAVLVAVQVYRAVQDPLIDQLSSALLAANLLLLGLIAHLLWTGWPQYRKVLALAGAFVLVGGFVSATATLSRQWHRQFANFYDLEMGTEVYRFLERHKPAEMRVAPFFYRIYPLFGSRRQFHVTQPLLVPSYDWLLRYLNEQQVTFVVTAATGPQGPTDRYDKVRRWALQSPAEFALTKESYRHLLFRFQPQDSRP